MRVATVLFGLAMGLVLAMGCGGKVAELGASGDAGSADSSGGSSEESSGGRSAGSSGGSSGDSFGASSTGGGNSTGSSGGSSGGISGSSSGGLTATSPPAVGTPACEDVPCILCGDGYYHCHSSVYPPCMSGISMTMNCANDAIPSYGCFVCGSNGKGNVWQCTDGTWDLNSYDCTP